MQVIMFKVCQKKGEKIRIFFVDVQLKLEHIIWLFLGILGEFIYHMVVLKKISVMHILVWPFSFLLGLGWNLMSCQGYAAVYCFHSLCYRDELSYMRRPLINIYFSCWMRKYWWCTSIFSAWSTQGGPG